MPTYRQALEKLMDNPTKLKVWKKKYGDATLANFTKESKSYKNNTNKKVNKINPKAAFGVSTGGNTTKAASGTTVEIGKGASNKLDEVVVTGKKPNADNIVLTRQQQRREIRDNKKANRRVGRTAKNYVKGGGDLDNFDQKGSHQAELAQIQRRRGVRKKFLRDFGSQLTRGVQSGERRAFGVDENGKRVVTGSSAFVEQSTDTDTDAKANAEANKIENKGNETDILEKIDTGGGDNSTLGVFGKDYSTFGAEYDTTAPNLRGFKLNNSRDGKGEKTDLANIPLNKIGPFAKVEEDSNPSSFMKKQFFKKMGY